MRIAGQNLHARLCNHKNLYISLMNKDRLDYADRMQATLILPNCRGWSGGAMVLGKLPVPGRPTCLD